MNTQIIDSTHPSPSAYLVQAINHFVMTGDHFGEATILNARDGVKMVMLAYNISDKLDVEDFRKFESRLRESVLKTKIDARIKKSHEANGYRTFLLQLHERDMLRLAQELLREAGRAGWGSLQPDIERYFPALRDQILSAAA